MSPRWYSGHAAEDGRETRGWLRVSDEGVKTKRQLQTWVNRGVEYAKNLPAK